MKIKHFSILLAVPMLLSMAACGGSSGADGAGSASPSVDQQTAWLRWARCLREQGVNMPDNSKGLPEGGLEIPDKAARACQQHRPQDGGTVNMNDPVVRDRLARFAKCMREHSFEMTENSAPDVRQKNPQKFDSAAKQCNHILREQSQ